MCLTQFLSYIKNETPWNYRWGLVLVKLIVALPFFVIVAVDDVGHQQLWVSYAVESLGTRDRFLNRVEILSDPALRIAHKVGYSPENAGRDISMD